jgi:hypothetical protein
LPKSLWYDGDGVVLWGTASDEEAYYQSLDDYELVENQEPRIISDIQPGAVIMDFGAGYGNP